MKYVKRFSKKITQKKVVDLLREGWTYRSGKKHGVIISPIGSRVAIPSTPSDYRAGMNFLASIVDF